MAALDVDLEDQVPRGTQMEVSENRGDPKSSKSLAHFSIETRGDLGIPHFKKSPMAVDPKPW